MTVYPCGALGTFAGVSGCGLSDASRRDGIR